MDETFKNLLRFECLKWVQVLVLKFHVCVSSYSIVRAYVLLLVKLWDLSSIVTIYVMGHIVVDCFSDLQARFECTTQRKIKFLNTSANEMIHNLFNNKNNNSLIIILIYVSNNFNSLKCKTILIEYITNLHLNCIQNYSLFKKS